MATLSVRNFVAKFQLYTVPGQVYYNMTRKLVLRGVDGIVFVADSQWDRLQENVESFQNLEENLRGAKLDLAEIPYVLQYNKRDLPNVAPVEYMEYLLNNRDVRVPAFEASAAKVEGVFETLNAIKPPCPTGPDIAQAVRVQRADCGIATRAVALAAGLDFVPLTWERFDLVLRQRDYFTPGPQALFDFLRTAAFRDRAAELGGYDVSETGRVRHVN